METITVQVGRKTVDMQLVDVADMTKLPTVTAEMVRNGWQAWIGYAKRANGSVHHEVYRSAKTGNYVSVQTITF